MSYHAGQATWTRDVCSAKWTWLVIWTTVSRGNHSRSLWTPNSWHVCSFSLFI